MSCSPWEAWCAVHVGQTAHVLWPTPNRRKVKLLKTWLGGLATSKLADTESSHIDLLPEKLVHRMWHVLIIVLVWNLHDDSSFYHAGIKNVVANISDWHPFKNQKTKYAYLLLSAWHVRPKYNGGRPPGLSNAARLSTFSNKKIETIIPGKEALTALRKTSVNKNSRTSLRISHSRQRRTC